MLNVPRGWVLIGTAAGGFVALMSFAVIQAVMAMVTPDYVFQWWCPLAAFGAGVLLTLASGAGVLLFLEQHNRARRHLR